MALPTCDSCGRILNPSFSPNGENPCIICIPRKPNGKPVAGVGPVSVLKETGEHRTPEAVEKAAEKAVKKKVAKKKVAKKKTAKKK